ncbi:MAG: zinc ribbon domain-containing protein [Pseudomonadota bacterium]
MPLYDYRCEQCGHKLEALQKISDDLLTDCPACGAASLRKQLSAPAFRLKGAGWYETDFKSGDKKNLHGEGQDKPAETETVKEKEKKEKASGSTEPASKKPPEGAKTTAPASSGTE